jgi:uncharacterized protein YuzE
MRFEYDKQADAAYIYFEYPVEGEVKNTVGLNEDINLDFDRQGKLLGVEILHASRVLNKKALLQAESV